MRSDFEIQTELGALYPSGEFASTIALIVFGRILYPDDEVAFVVIEIFGDIHLSGDQFVGFALNRDAFLSHALSGGLELLPVLGCVSALVVVEVALVGCPVFGADLIHFHVEFVDVGGEEGQCALHGGVEHGEGGEAVRERLGRSSGLHVHGQ